MKTVYRVLAFLIAALVMVQAAAIAYAVFGLAAWIQGGGTLDKAAMESEATKFAGEGGFAVHGIFGLMVIPVIALLFLISSFFAKVQGGVKFALYTFAAVVVQVALGAFAHDVAALGVLHGIVALILFGVATMSGVRVRWAGQRRAQVDVTEPVAPATVAR